MAKFCQVFKKIWENSKLGGICSDPAHIVLKNFQKF